MGLDGVVKARSVLFTGPGQVEVVDQEVPSPGPGAVRVEAELSGISAGTELLVYKGQAPESLPADARLAGLQGALRFPLHYGYSLVGRVCESGPGVEPHWQGRRVFAFCPHQSQAVCPAEQLTLLDSELAPLDAVFLSNMESAVNLVQDGAPLVGERVLVLGQGVVGLLVTALLARFPLAELVTADPLPARRQLSLEMGAGASLAPEELPGGFDLTFEVSGHPATLNTALASTGFSGRVVIGSWYGTRRAEIDLGGSFHRSRIRILSSQVSTLDPHLTGAWTHRRRLSTAARLLGEIRPGHLVSHRFPLERAAEAYSLLASGGGQALQVVLDY